MEDAIKGQIRTKWKMPQNNQSHQNKMEDATKPSQRVTSGHNGRCHKTTTKGHIRAKWKTPQNNINTAGAGYF